MHKLLYFATIGLLAFSIGGCGGEGSNTASPSPSPSAASPSPAASASPTPAAQTFQSPIVAAQPPGLIRSTNPEERARQAQTRIGNNKNRNPTQSLPPEPSGPLTANPSQVDPFGPLPPIALQTGMTSGVPKLPQREVGALPKLPQVAPPQIGVPIPGTDITFFPGGTGAQVGSSPQIPGLNVPQLGRLPTSPPGLEPIAARPIGVPDLPELPVDNRPPQWRDPNPPPPPPIPRVAPPPPPPSTDLATGTEVSGVVKVGKETQVIVKVPNEPTSRYVKIGQRLSNGQVLVKRVDLKEGADPIVILEQNGVEVAKAVGEKPPSREQQPAHGVISRLPNPTRSTRR